MSIDAETFRRIVKPIFPARAELSAGNATAIAQLAYLAADADLDDALEERSLRTQPGRHMCALGGLSFERVPRPSSLPTTMKRASRGSGRSRDRSARRRRAGSAT